MKKIYIWIIFFTLFAINEILGSSSVECDYNSNYNYYVVGYKYSCYVSNNLNISSPESAKIVAVNGTHMRGKSNNDEIYFYAESKHIEYFPRGLEKFFTNLTGIAIYESQIKEIHKDDLKHYIKLKYLHLPSNNIEVIEDGLFDYQPDIELIDFDTSKIFHISPTVFDNLPKLTTLYLGGNSCTSKYSKNNRANTLEVIKSVKSTCVSSDFSKLDEKLKNLENDCENLNPGNVTAFKKNVQNFETEWEISKFSKFQSLKERVFKISDWKLLMLSDKIETIQNVTAMRTEADISAMRIELNDKIENQNDQIKSIIDKFDEMKNILSEMNNRPTIRNPWMILAIGVVGFTQVIILAVIYKQFIA